jgi:hypothetical protein
LLKQIFLLIALLTNTAAWTQSAPEAACKALDASHEERIAGCTAIIDAKRETGRALALAYCNRGFALTEKRELDRALSDLEEAIARNGRHALVDTFPRNPVAST